MMPKDNMNLEESKSWEKNPFLAAKTLVIDSGATPIFKVGQKIGTKKNEGIFMIFLVRNIKEF